MMGQKVSEPMNQARARKLGGRIAEIVAEMLERRIKDPRLGFVTVTDARLTGICARRRSTTPSTAPTTR